MLLPGNVVCSNAALCIQTADMSSPSGLDGGAGSWGAAAGGELLKLHVMRSAETL